MDNLTRNDGLKLRERMKSRGYDMRGLANRLNISRVSVEKDFSKETITRRALVKYIPVLFESLEEFYGNELLPSSVGLDKSTDVSVVIRYKDEMLAAKDEIIQEQRKHIETLTNMLRFFPSAVQQATITA